MTDKNSNPDITTSTNDASEEFNEMRNQKIIRSITDELRYQIKVMQRVFNAFAGPCPEKGEGK